MAPLVKASKGRTIDVVVRRTVGPADATAEAAALTAALTATLAAATLAAAPDAAPDAALATAAPDAAPATGAVAAAVGSVQYLRVSLVPAEWEGQGLLGCRLKAVPEAESAPVARERGSFDVRA